MQNSLQQSKALETAKRVFFSLLLPLSIYGILCIFAPKVFLQGSTFTMIFTQTLANIAIGWSMIFGLSLGLFDFSVGSRIILAGMVGMYFAQIYGAVGFLVGCYAMALILALITGFLYSFFRIPSIITGFAVLLIFEAVAALVRAQMRTYLDPAFLFLGRKPYIYVVLALMFVAVYIVYNKTKFGYQVKAVGGDELVAKSMGIPVGKLKLLTYLVGGAFLGVATIVYISYIGIVNNETNMQSISMSFTPIMGVLLGMMIKSCNPVIGSMIGSFSIAIVSTGFVALGIESRLQNVVIGIFLIGFMGLRNNTDSLLNWFQQVFQKQPIGGAHEPV